MNQDPFKFRGNKVNYRFRVQTKEKQYRDNDNEYEAFAKSNIGK